MVTPHRQRGLQSAEEPGWWYRERRGPGGERGSPWSGMAKRQPGMAALDRQEARSYQRTGNMQAAPESDKDSGFSDVASECLSSVEQTDSEEAPPSSRWSAARNPLQCPQPRPPPLLILKNLLVDQGSGPDPHIHPWTVSPSFQLLPTSSQILVFPPSVTAAKPQPPSGKSTKYLPILNSYPKIAPHPTQLPHRGSKRVADTWHQNRIKKPLPGLPCSGASENPVTSILEGNALEGPVHSEVAAGLDPGLTTAPSDTTDTCDADGSDSGATPFSDISYKSELSVLPQQKNKSHRFQNTLDVLHRSGLLSIAIKTKELARINQVTQTQLEKLQEQVSLYSKAMCSNSPEDWQKLQDLLAEGSRPLKEIGL